MVILLLILLTYLMIVAVIYGFYIANGMLKEMIHTHNFNFATINLIIIVCIAIITLISIFAFLVIPSWFEFFS